MLRTLNLKIRTDKPFWRVEPVDSSFRVCMESHEADITLVLSREALRRLLMAGAAAVVEDRPAFVNERGKIFLDDKKAKKPVQVGKADNWRESFWESLQPCA